MKHRGMFIVVIGVVGLFLAGCAGTVKEYDATTGKKISSTPAGVAVIKSAAEQMDDCPTTSPMIFSVSDITKLSASAQAEAVRNIPMLIALGMIQDKDSGNNCYTQIAKEAQAFFAAQSVKYNNWGMVGRVGLIGGFSYLALDSLFEALAVGSTSYVTNLGNRSVGAGSGGGGSTSASGNSDLSGITINNGFGNASDRAMAAPYADKVIGVPLNGDSNFDGQDEAGIRLNDPDEVKTDIGFAK